MSEPTTPTYAQLAEYLAYLAGLADITGGLVDLDTIRPLAQEVRLASVKALLFARQSDILDQDNVEQFPLFLELLNGVAIEVESITGTDPHDPAIRALAVQAITIETAAQIEFAAYPEQQLGDSARANQLTARYNAIIVRLTRAVQDTPDGAIAPAVPSPVGNFPPAPCYPDPAGIGYYGWPR